MNCWNDFRQTGFEPCLKFEGMFWGGKYWTRLGCLLKAVDSVLSVHFCAQSPLLPTKNCIFKCDCMPNCIKIFVPFFSSPLLRIWSKKDWYSHGWSRNRRAVSTPFKQKTKCFGHCVFTLVFKSEHGSRYLNKMQLSKIFVSQNLWLYL